MSTNQIGKPTNRVDGRAKVTGEAKYAAEFHVPDLAHGVVVNSAIAKGKIKKIDTSKAMAVEGVFKVITHENRKDYACYDKDFKDMDAPPGSPFRPLYNGNILFNMQPVALVVAETLELARYAATLVEVAYEEEAHETDFEANRGEAYVPEKYNSTTPPKPWGNPEEALAKADVKVEVEYAHPTEHHNPMEMHATVAVWEENGKLTVYDKIQGVENTLQYITSSFGLPKEKVHVLSPFVGGAFGSGLRPQYQSFLAVLAALELKRPVRVMLTRPQMFSFGHRPRTTQRFALGASKDGKLEALIQDVFAETSTFEDYSEDVVIWPGLLYKCDNMKFSHKLVALDEYTPLDMRAPGGTTGIFALESAVDELAYKLGMDPLVFRLKNYTDKDQNNDLPFSSKELRACYIQGAEKFGWEQRSKEPRSMRNGHQLVGWGVAHGAWEAQQAKASAKAVLTTDGKLTISSATADIGTGTYTVMTQIAAETLGLPLEDVTFKLGDTSLPFAPLEGGSKTVSTVGSAVKKVCEKIGEKLLRLAQQQANSPLKDAELKDVTFTDGRLHLKSDTAKAVSFKEIMQLGQREQLEEEVSSKPSEEQKKFARFAHSVAFVEVKVDEDLGAIQVSRIVTAIAGGRIINPKTAKSQIMGAAVWGIGVALEEESVMDNNYGRFMNHDLEKYHVPVNADVHDIDVIFVEEQDTIVNALGAKGLGEIGIVSIAPAIVNAVFHATGKRIRHLPIKLDKLL
ncbi:xanthine dehydrogenase YagR molybdenum-binding subunit [Pontibacter ummariensis]|uniref:Xanthine dehydrogenase, molybdenum binding subunit apoprotein n=1 Tax=Pontibacter ummariensis TaxID=1610492 RepID=A0A239I372_9BACT|nr:xanthine dehydrogenase family protein molybdopterin-binding subunit [Pontibacter ummariensis]PRY10205.1 xanthine dehydrogenase YagR molybdenum-binding subunit [Pontibacter ummariensis]SNS88065.1 xanthine dehydrogenase, molybdenum binding subunit apoprotein [Pontibacter ummariensis]